jgi:PAS domain-containing protein
MKTGTKLFFLQIFDIKPVRAMMLKIGFLLFLFCLYCVSFKFLWQGIGEGIDLIALLLMVLCGLLFGLRLGMLFAFGALLLNMILFHSMTGLTMHFYPNEVYEDVVFAAVAGLAGGLSDFIRRLHLHELDMRKELGEHQQATSMLRNSEQKLLAIFKGISDIIFVIDKKGYCIELAPTGYHYAETFAKIMGKNLTEFFSQEQCRYFFDVMDGVLSSQQASLIRYALPVNNDMREFEAQITPLSEDTALWISTDVTEKEQAKETLRERDVQYKNIFENAAEGICTIDLQSKTIQIGRAHV